MPGKRAKAWKKPIVKALKKDISSEKLDFRWIQMTKSAIEVMIKDRLTNSPLEGKLSWINNPKMIAGIVDTKSFKI